MKTMKILREKGKMTKFLVLYKSAVEKPNKLADLASELNMTEQAVSNYISEIEDEGLIDRSGGAYRPTSKGLKLVRDVISDLNTFLDEAKGNIDFISTCIAIASEDIREGERIGLFMKDGFLHASTKEMSSTGTALHNASEGEPIKVGGLEGIIDMELGKIWILPVNLEIDSEKIQKKLKEIEYDKLATKGEMPFGICNSLEISPNIEFAPLEASISAAEKGLNTLVMIPKKNLNNVIEKLNSRNKGREEEYKIKYKVINI